MKILIAGQERTRELAGRLSPDVSRKGAHAPAFLSPQHSALTLRTARDTAEYLDILLRLIWIRRGVSDPTIAIPRERGLLRKAQAKARALLWRLQHYPRNQLLIQQNTLNELVIAALECERDQRLRETAELRRRLDVLEQRQDGPT